MADTYYPLLLNSPEDSEEDDAEVRVHHIPKRYTRDALNPLEFYRDVEFKRRYRFSKDAVLHGILPLIQWQKTTTGDYQYSQLCNCCFA
jgi:hypothetical protein